MHVGESFKDYGEGSASERFSICSPLAFPVYLQKRHFFRLPADISMFASGITRHRPRLSALRTSSCHRVSRTEECKIEEHEMLHTKLMRGLF